MEKQNFSALLGINGYKAVAVISLAIVGIYASKKIVDKFYNSSVSINAESKNTEGK